MKLLFYNTDLTPWADYVIAADWLKIERQKGMDEIQVVAIGEGLVFRLLEALCCHVIEDSKISMWVLDRSSLKEERAGGMHRVSFALYEPLWLLNIRVADRHVFEEAELTEFTKTLINENTAGDRALGDIDLSALNLTAYSVTKEADGEPIADLMSEVYSDRGPKLYFEMSVANGMKLAAKVQEIAYSSAMMLSPLLRNMAVNLAKATKEFGAVYVAGDYQQNAAEGDNEPIRLRGYFSFGDSGLYREEHYVKSQVSSDELTQAEFQNLLDEEAIRIAKKRTVNIDISTVPEIIQYIETLERYNRAGVVFPADIDGQILMYMVDEVKETPGGVSLGVSRYKEEVSE